jgi:hypothetical protein
MAPVNWKFDFTSLMILIGEPRENTFRSSRDSICEVLVLAPIAGIQSYLKSYEALPKHSTLEYISPYGVKRAPLRNMRLHHFISYWELLKNGNYNSYDIKGPEGGKKADQKASEPESQSQNQSRPQEADQEASEPESQSQNKSRPQQLILLCIWLIFTWVYFVGVVAFWHWAPFGVLPKGTWIGIANIVTLTGWSVTIRIFEFVIIKKHEKAKKTHLEEKHSTTDLDGIIFLGEKNSGLVFKGSRADIKYWTSTNRLDYREGQTLGIANVHFQSFSLTGTILVLVFIFLTLPNGSTTDQIAFILLNLLGQLNLDIGLRLNAFRCRRSFERTTEPRGSVLTRTHVWGFAIRQFENLDQTWIDKVDLLPKTWSWDQWKTKVRTHKNAEPKDLWDEIDRNQPWRPRTLPNPNQSHTASAPRRATS